MPRAREDEQAEAELPPLEEVMKREAPPWLISAAVQGALLLILGLWTITEPKKNVLDLAAGYSDNVGDEFSDDAFDFESDMPEDDEYALSLSTEIVADPLAASMPLAPSLEGTVMSTEVNAQAVGMALEGRDAGMKEALLSAYGGGKATEAAVMRALEWLSRQQKSDGSWSMKGPYTDGSISFENNTAATAMALLAFLGNGQTHLRGNFKKNIDKGMKFLLKKQDDSGNFFQEGKRDQWLYTQGQCTIVVCEAYAMTKDTALREAAEKAVKFAVLAQHKQKGGWRYAPGSDSDTSVTGWMLMGLQSARMAGLEVPKETFDGVRRYLDAAALDGGVRYSYQPGQTATECMTAEGLLCRQWLGWGKSDPRLKKGAEWLLTEENLPSWRIPDVYYWYYATQMMHHMEGSYWKRWNESIRDMLVERQNTSGKERGSWDPLRPAPDRWGSAAGRLYMTCMCVYILETYYRHLPLYANQQ